MSLVESEIGPMNVQFLIMPAPPSKNNAPPSACKTNATTTKAKAVSDASATD
jgi:hypothetical protein